MGLHFEVLLFAVVGGLGGAALGMVAIGTALLAVPFLTVFLPLVGVPSAASALSAIATSMAVIAVATLVGVVSNAPRGSVCWQSVIIAAPGAALGAAAGTRLAPHLPISVLTGTFGMLLIWVAARMLLRRLVRRPPDDRPPSDTHRSLLAMGPVSGFVGAIVGGGGNVLMVPFLRQVLALPMPMAVGTAIAIALPASVVGTASYAMMSSPDGTASMLGMIHVPAFVGLAVGNTLGVPLGVAIGRRVRGEVLEICFAVVLLAIAVKHLLG